ncbi:protein of unknown function [Paraburkholderia kururiensis]
MDPLRAPCIKAAHEPGQGRNGSDAVTSRRFGTALAYPGDCAPLQGHGLGGDMRHRRAVACHGAGPVAGIATGRLQELIHA